MSDADVGMTRLSIALNAFCTVSSVIDKFLLKSSVIIGDKPPRGKSSIISNAS